LDVLRWNRDCHYPLALPPYINTQVLARVGTKDGNARLVDYPLLEELAAMPSPCRAVRQSSFTCSPTDVTPVFELPTGNAEFPVGRGADCAVGGQRHSKLRFVALLAVGRRPSRFAPRDHNVWTDTRVLA
jgi:hypothetical protein